ncbi:unnamed protein product [Eruca vesicaria subsp. sativa]|uniref:Peroxidase n=1 Tax=Eruca vesicaria subsp. sativa TaxID=29727 RepID=A0ABC8M698_ERUVS|nr:unnamed protein product [Eruca vesicaria subsp. sativa]
MPSNQLITFLVIVVSLLLQGNNNAVVEAQLNQDFYSSTCPSLLPIVRGAVRTNILLEPRMGASILRLFYHDCFVNGCDGSILLDDTSSFTGEQNAASNRNSARGFNVIDNIKSRVERECPGIVSCADILAIAARDSVVQLGGPSWDVLLGRRDARTASQAAANSSIPAPTSSLRELITSFRKAGFTTREMVALSGAHTIGQAQCRNFQTRIYNETNISPFFAARLRLKCPPTSGDRNLASLDYLTPFVFDNNYFRNLMSQKGLLHSDQELFNGGSTDSIVREYSQNPTLFRSDFSAAMFKMSLLNPLTGSDGDVRQICGRRRRTMWLENIPNVTPSLNKIL